MLRGDKVPLRSKKFIYKTSAVVIPVTFVILSVIAVIYIQRSYQKTEQELIAKETEFVSFELAENLRRNIMYRVRILEIVSQARPDIFPNNEAYFNKIIPVVLNNLPGFYAINWVNPEGVIKWVSPLEPNLVAKNKNILDRREVRHYLESSRDKKTPYVSHIIDLFQGPKGMIIYVPIFYKGEFKGWYNGVLGIQNTLDRFFKRRSLHNISVKVRWKGHDDYIYKYGPESSGKAEIQFESEVLNQTILVEVDLKRGSAIETRTQHLNRVFIMIYIAVFLIATFLFYIIRYHFILMNLHQALSRDKTLLNILTHDMATPLTLISENITRLKDKLKNNDFAEIQRIIRASDKQKDLLARVRSFHAANLGKIKVDLVPVAAKELIDETVALYEEQLKEKEISCNIEISSDNLYCLTDRITAVNNVMANVMSNSLKFSEHRSKITIRAFKEKNSTVIEFEDQGHGISKDVLENLFVEDESTTTRGTQGELGTGLGMLQIKTFMDLYKGQVKIHTSERGTKVQLYFRSAEI